MSQYTTQCTICGYTTSKKYSREHNGMCKRCVESLTSSDPSGKIASREEQNARYIDSGPQAWDDN